MDKKIVQTVCYVVDFKKKKILLGYKKDRLNKKGFGVGKFNGHGGCLKKDESIENATARELVEESGLSPLLIKKCGIVLIKNGTKPVLIELHFFLVYKYDGKVIEETDEMINKWFSLAEIHYEKMWPSDEILLPLFLVGRKVVGRFYYDEKDSLVWYEIQEVANLPDSIEQ